MGYNETVDNLATICPIKYAHGCVGLHSVVVMTSVGGFPKYIYLCSADSFLGTGAIVCTSSMHGIAASMGQQITMTSQTCHVIVPV